MKKIFSIMLTVIVACSITVSAQRASEFSIDSEDWNHSGIFAELGAGISCGNVVDTDLGLSIGVGYRYHFGSGFNWDILKVAYYNPCTTDDAFEEGSSMRFLTGVRYNSAPILAGHPLYASFGLGYQLNVADSEYSWTGFAYEVGVGVNISRSCSLGLMWEGNVAYHFGYYGEDNANLGILGLKLGVLF